MKLQFGNNLVAYC